MARHIVAPVAEIAPGDRRLVELDGRRIVLFNLEGEFFALADRCPHQGGPLSKGPTMGLVESPCPGEYSYGREGEIIRCPWHAWEFDIRTGRSRFDPRRMKVRAFPACVEKGEALQAETFPVSVEADYVVVEV
ncbi:Rieske (2Fe-2S) protein [Rhodovarius lipocyclicus]|uniref:Rieske (2Fe-2S) protein n=1 Tax=Rhodovarius lipocyclicus TaxID=268410 RepID=UPI00135B4551|nr:Rieske (2Fe-2S) protein [Rhodovarius lipocyclicus]